MTFRSHFILSNRKVYSAFGKKYLHIENEIEPDLPLHYTYYPVPMRASARTRITSDVADVNDRFIEHVLLESASHKNVTLFIHGFHHLFNLSFKVDIFNKLVQQYCEKHNAVGKFIFFSWPSSQSRHFLDDRAHAQGLMLQKNYIGLFERLHDELNSRDIKLNLMVHSMGHRLLNGFLSGLDHGKKIFDKVFLFAPDVPHKSLDISLPGVVIRNRKNSVRDGETPSDDEWRVFNLTKLSEVSNETHTYYYKYDRILLAGVGGELKRFEESNKNLVNDCLCLGNLGNERIQSHSNIFFHNASEFLLSDNHFSKFLVKNRYALEDMENIFTKNEIHDGAKLFAALPLTRDPWVKLHRYFVECEGVVKDVAGHIQNNSQAVA